SLDIFHYFPVLLTNLFSLHSGKALQAEFEYCLSLNFRHTILSNQAFFRDVRRSGISDQGYHLIKMVECNQEPFQYMSPLLCFSQFILRTAHDNFVPEVDKLTNQVFDVQRTWTALHERYIVDSKRSLQLGIFVELVDNYLGNRIALQFQYDSGTFLTVALI